MLSAGDAVEGKCPRCDNVLCLVKCPNEDCQNDAGDQNWFFRGLDECPYCKTRVAECPYRECRQVIHAELFEHSGAPNCCPHCEKMLAKSHCPNCYDEIYVDESHCPRCEQALPSVECPNEDCVDADGERNWFFRGLNECPFCKTKVEECPHCEVKVRKCMGCEEWFSPEGNERKCEDCRE